MNKDQLFENLKRLGLVMMETDKGLDVNQTLAEVVKSRDIRIWEGFPVLLANAGQEYCFDYEQTLKKFCDNDEITNFHSLLLLSLALYVYFHLSFVWANELKKKFSDENLFQLQEFKKALSHDDFLTINNINFDTDRLKTTFQNYFQKDASKAADLKKKHEEMSLEYALSQLFSPKQKELFKKKLSGAALTKTEKEYYSRTVKKKVVALANPELNRLAQKLMEY